jgi:hypothetical protein
MPAATDTESVLAFVNELKIDDVDENEPAFVYDT